MEDNILKKFKAKSALLTLLALSFVALFAVGCGDSRDDFVITNTNNNPATQGNLVFNFQQAVTQQVPDTVPAGTASLRFDFFSTNPPDAESLVFTETRAFAQEIVIEDVPSNVVSVLVTAFDANGFPLATLSGDVTVIIGATNPVDLDDSNPVTFDALTVAPDPVLIVIDDNGNQATVVETGSGEQANGNTEQLLFTGSFSVGTPQTLPATASFLSFSDISPVANVSSTGLITGNEDGTDDLTTTYTIGSQARTDTVTVNNYFFNVTAEDGVELLPTDTYGGRYTAEFAFGADQLANVAANSTFALQGTPTGITIDPDTGDLELENATPGTFNVIVTWVDGRSTGGTGNTYTNVVEFRVRDVE